MSTQPAHNAAPRVSAPNSPFLRDLLGELRTNLEREMSITLRVAVCKAARMPHAEMLAKLGITEPEARMAMIRLGSVTGDWMQ